MKRFIQSITSLLFSGLILYALLWRFDFPKVFECVRQARLSYLFLGAVLLVTAYLLRGFRWQIWKRRLSYWDSFSLILIGFMGNNLLPARLGEILRAHCAASKTSDDQGRTAALASISAERILDALVLSLLGLIGVAMVPVDRRLHWGLFAISLAFASPTLALVFGIHFHEQIRFLISASNKRFPGHVTAYAREKAAQFLDGLLPLKAWPRMIGAFTLSAVIWGVEIGFYYFVGFAVWDGMSVRIALLSLVVANFASLVPLAVGGIGTIEAAVPLFLASSGVPLALALAIVLMQHAGQYLFTTLTGGVLYLAGGFYRISLSSAKSVEARRDVQTALPPIIDETRSTLGQLCSLIELKPALKSEPLLSLVIPAYNEQARLPRTALETIHWCTTQGLEFELILADDGSRDETLTLARLFEESDRRIRVLACPHMGKGATVRIGMLNARGRFVLFMDADGATPLSEVPKLLAALENGYDVAIGSRVAQRPGEVRIETSAVRRFIGRGFAFFVNLFAFGGIGDTQCGFKMFRRDVAAAIFSRQKTVGFAFDVEILFLARQMCMSIAEIPVNWTAQPGSKVNLVTDSLKMLWDIAQIRWLHRKWHAVPLVASGRQFVN